VHNELWPMFQECVDLVDCLFVVARQKDLLPQFGRRVCTFDCLYAQVEFASSVNDSCVVGVCKGTGLTVAQASDILSVATEVGGHCLYLERAEVVVYCGPDDFVGLHLLFFKYNEVANGIC